MITTAARLMSWRRPAPTAAELVDLVDAGICTPPCLFGHDGSPCECRCGEKYHGLAREVPPRNVPPPASCQNCHKVANPDQWWVGAGKADPVEVEYHCPHCGHGWTGWVGAAFMLTQRAFGAELRRLVGR